MMKVHVQRGASVVAPVVDARPVALDVAGHGLRGNVPLGNLDVGRTSVKSLRLLHHDGRGLSNTWALEMVVS